MEIIHDVDQPRQETRTCRICNEVGHLARNCPQAPPREETRKCHICGEVGHIARYCPENTGDGGARRETRKCHVCGEVGHLARNCPNAEDGGDYDLSLIHISEPTRLLSISYAVFCLKKKKR